MPKILRSVAKFLLGFTSAMFLISLIFEGLIFNTLQLLLLGSIFSLGLSLYAQSKENQTKNKKIT